MSDLELNLELQPLTILSADLAKKKKKKKNYKNYVVIIRLTIYRSELVTHDII